MATNEKNFCMCLRSAPGQPADTSSDRAAMLNGAKWPKGGTVTVTFLEGSQALRDRVQKVANEWVKPGGPARLTLRWVDDDQANIRIAFKPGDGSWSYLGTVCTQIDPPNPTMNYGWLTDASPEAELRRVVLHEFGHALGLIHEHQNPKGGIVWNEAAVIADLSGPPNNWTPAQIRTNVLDKYMQGTGTGEVTATTLDPDSIMLYPIPAAWTLPDPKTGKKVAYDLNGELSATDKAFVGTEYS